MEQQAPCKHAVGWGGWWLPLPEPWRFFKVEGSYNKGSLILGDERHPRLELAWAWVTRRHFNSREYLKKFLTRGRFRKHKQPLRVLDLPGFSSAAAVDTETGTAGAGFCAETSRLLHWAFDPGEDAGDVRYFEQQCLPGWRDQSLEHPIRWKFFGHDFVTPPGFRPRSFRLDLGDMEVTLVDPTSWHCKRQLRLGLVYPASLALSRQPIEKWLTTLMERQRSVYRTKGRPLPFETQGLPGVNQEARLPLLLRTVLKPFTFRMSPYARASLHHLAAADKLVYLHLSAPPGEAETIREEILGGLTAP